MEGRGQRNYIVFHLKAFHAEISQVPIEVGWGLAGATDWEDGIISVFLSRDGFLSLFFQAIVKLPYYESHMILGEVQDI